MIRDIRFPFFFPYSGFFCFFFLKSWYTCVASLRRTKQSRRATSTRGSPPISAAGPTDHVHLLLHLPFYRRWTLWRRMMERQWTTMMMMMRRRTSDWFERGVWERERERERKERLISMRRFLYCSTVPLLPSRGVLAAFFVDLYSFLGLQYVRKLGSRPWLKFHLTMPSIWEEKAGQAKLKLLQEYQCY